MLAVGGEAEMPRLDDAGMHRPDRNLVQAFAFHRQEDIGRGLLRGPAIAKRMADIPKSAVEPSARVGRANGVQPEQIADRTFEPDRRRMARADAWIVSIRAGVTEHDDTVETLAEQRHMHVGGVAPQPEQRAAAGRKMFDRLPPPVVADNGARPRPVRFDLLKVWNVVEWVHNANLTTGRRSRSRRPEPAAGRHLP